jgi:Thioesterase-like superfamily
LIGVCKDAPVTERPAHFTPRDGGFLPNRFAHSHWGDDHLNGPAIVGLAAQTLETRYGSPEFMPARLTVDLFKVARGVPTTVATALIRDGRRVRNAECDILQDGVPVARATLVAYRRSAPPAGQEWSPTIDFVPPINIEEPSEASSVPFTGSDSVGWTRKVGDHQNVSRKRFLDRGIDVVAGVRNTPFVRAAMAAESTSLVTNMGTRGIGYINGDLTVGLVRLPVGAWIAVQADSHWAADGIAVGTATLFDSGGPFGSGLVTAVSNPAAQIDFSNPEFLDLRI